MAKAETAELKANESPDGELRTRAYREAAHEWERAANREPAGKKKAEYEANAARLRAQLEN